MVIIAFSSILLDVEDLSSGAATATTEKTYLSCVDSDFDNQFIPGTVTLTYTEKGIKKTEVRADSCSGKTLTEQICQGNKIPVSQASTCVNGCGKSGKAAYCKCDADSQCGKGYGCLKSTCVKNK